MSELIWQAQALADRQAIVALLAERSSADAINWDHDLTAKLAQAAANPTLLPAGRVADTLEWVLLPHYLVVFQQPSAQAPLRVLRIVHSSKTWPQARSLPPGAMSFS